ncbi:cation:proton antiporter [Christiangramia aquimixticola]|uniref:cation:proton antiporter n=1 Tax=Christiangramia aquimixticola TaxID=1697558 RepID=UPI003AA96BFC
MLEFLYLDFNLPLTNPVLKFLIILLIILIIPILLNKVKVPAILGLIIAGAFIGPHGLNLLERDSGIILSGTAGLLYIMFLAGLEIDLGDFKKNRSKSLLFGLYTFSIPMVLGILGGLYLLEYNLITSVLLASMFASHTLIAYPLVRRIGISRNIAVNISVGGTIITDTLALLVLAVIVGMSRGEVDLFFWVRLIVSVLIFSIIVLYLFPIIAKWFFNKISDAVSQYIFVLSMVFLAAFLSELAGIEGIIGAFLCGLSLNSLIPRQSPLMDKVEFVGNAIFIPFFLIGIGMLIDYELFFSDLGSLKVGGVMILIATTGKYIAAKLAQYSMKLSSNEGLMIFGLSNAQAAATLAAVLIGHNIILGYTAAGLPIRLLNEEVLNGTILMILFTCTVASFATERAGRGILAEKAKETGNIPDEKSRILIPIKNENNVEDLINFASRLQSENSETSLMGLNIVSSSEGSDSRLKAVKMLEHAKTAAGKTNNKLEGIIRYDDNVSKAISAVIKENEITDLVLGLHTRAGEGDTNLGMFTEALLNSSEVNIYIYKPHISARDITKYLVVIPEHAELEMGFYSLLTKLHNLAVNSQVTLKIYCFTGVKHILETFMTDGRLKVEIDPVFENIDISKVMASAVSTEAIIFFMNRRDEKPYASYMDSLPGLLQDNNTGNAFFLWYSNSTKYGNLRKNLINASLDEPVEKLEGAIRKLIKGRKA